MEFELPIDFKELLQLFGQHKVRYLLIGGIAARFGGKYNGKAELFRK
jgi:hypothetical protein